MTRVWVVDPGPHVGCAYWSDDPAMLETEELTPEVLLANAETQIRDWADMVVVESFRIGGSRAREANVTIEQIGVLRYLASRYGREFVEQTAADARAFSTNEKLRALGFWRRGDSDHARSAARHLCLYLARTGLVGAQQLRG